MQPNHPPHAPPAQDDLLRRIRTHPFLADIEDPHLKTLSQCAMPVEFSANETVFREHDLANRFYLIESGCVRIQSARPGHPPRIIDHIHAGDVLGWSWLFPPYTWHFDALATEPTSGLFFYGTRLRQLVEDDPALGCELLRRMAAVVIRRLQATRRQLGDAPASS